MNIKKIVISTLAALGITFVSFAPAFAANTTTTVNSTNLANNLSDVIAHPSSWFFYNDETDAIDNTLGSFVVGPGTAPLGLGSAQISVNGSQRRNLATYQFSGTPLASISALKFSTYNPSAGNGGSVNRSGYLNFNVDFNGSDTWQRRLVYVPSQNGTVQQNTWQEWDAINGGNAKWSYSGDTWPDTNVGPDQGLTNVPGTTLRTWSAILADYPGIRIRVTDSWLGVRVGEPYPDGYTENIDKFVFGTASGTKTFDFEPSVGPPSNFDQCKNNGWKNFNNPSFTNQGLCVAYVATHHHLVQGDIGYTAYGLGRHAAFAMDTAINSGTFFYYDANHDWYLVDVSNVSANSNNAWFAGKVTHASNPAWVGNWLFAKVEDNSPDKIWGSFATQTAAVNGVTSMTNPADGPFNVTSGSLTVH